MTESPPIIFIRHGETDWNRERRIQGRADVPLNKTGQAQASAIARRLKDITGDPAGYQFHCSPLLRARQTMAPILAEFGLAESCAHYDARLSERAFGRFDGRHWPELFRVAGDPAQDPDGYFDWRPEGGESYADIMARVESWLASLTRPAIAVSHSAPSRALRGVLLGLGKREILHLPVPQHRFFRIADGRLEWFEAATRLVHLIECQPQRQ